MNAVAMGRAFLRFVPQTVSQLVSTHPSRIPTSWTNFFLSACCLSACCLLCAVLVTAGFASAAVTIGTVPLAPEELAVRVVPWSTLPGDIQQMATQADGLYFATQQGQVWRYNALGNRDAEPFLDIAAERGAVFGGNPVATSNGLRGLAFHPQYATPGTPGYGKVYTMHTERFGQPNPTHPLQNDWNRSSMVDSVLFEWSMDPLTHQLTSSRQVYRVQYPYGDHIGQQIAFNPTSHSGDADFGNIYLTFGDGGGPCSPSNSCNDYTDNNVGQSFDNVLASIVRINPLSIGGAAFTIPADNPFVGDDQRLAELFAVGFRHPQTLAFDQVTGKLFVGDISHNNVEEINLIEPGKNYGWGLYEGTYQFVAPGDSNSLQEVPLATRQVDDYTYPVAQFDHASNLGSNAVVTGAVYHGVLAQELQGFLLFSSLSHDRIYVSPQERLANDDVPADVMQLRLLDDDGLPTSLGEIVGVGTNGRANIRFGQDQSGEIYVMSKANDTIYRLQGTFAGGPYSVLGDVNIDGNVDQQDVADFLAGWLTEYPLPGETSWRNGDLDLDGKVGLRDVFVLHEALADRGQAFPFDMLGTTAPEPRLAFAWTCVLMCIIWRSGRNPSGRDVFV
ncbi:MAG: PQQ-dependent sugar dehydrogenase [Pirellulaceae bacterium]|nr:PQQ-dependent sugar dehydrogenase [Planctomycetales bacterium]